MITTAEGMAVEYFISAGAFVDMTAFQAINLNLPANSTLEGDTDYELVDYYQGCEQRDLLSQGKTNAQRKDYPALVFSSRQ